MGSYRFLLAAFVAYSHFEGAFLPINLGVSSVIAFYFISGYLMSLSFERFQAKTANPARSFYADRIIRLYPAYLLVFAASLLFFWYSSKLNDLRTVNLLELLVIPNNYTQLFAHKLNLVIPPSWSLGAEFQFYLLLPLLFRISPGGRAILLYASVLLHLLALGLSGTLGEYLPSCQELSQRACDARASDLIGYRYLFLVGVIFLLGNITYEIYEKKSLPQSILHIVIGTYILGFFLLFPIGKKLGNENTYAVLLGVMLFIPLALRFLEQLRSGVRQGEIDKWLGKLAYPLFLSHFLGQWIVEMVWGRHSQNPFFFTQAMLASITLAMIVAQFQDLVDRWRYAYRGFGRVTGKTMTENNTNP